MTLEGRLANKEIIILDGAIGTEIARLGGAMDDAAWCAVANKTHPDVVCRVHQEYLRAGVDVVTANTFATCRHVLAGCGLANEASEMTAKAVELAHRAIDEVAPDRPVAVAGSMSNNVAWIPGTISPDPRFLPTLEAEAANYREMADTLASAGADLILLEMMSDAAHASLAVEAAVATGLPVWIGVSCALLDNGSVSAWDMHTVEPAENLDIGHAPQEISPLAAHCRGWVDDRVQIIGGCCGTTVEHIRALVDALPDRIRADSA